MTIRATMEGGKVVFEDSASPAAAKAAPWDGESVAGVVVKADLTRRYTLMMGYPAYKADTAVAQDGYRDFAGEEAVEDAAWAFMKSRQVGLFHEDGTEGAGDVVESYVYRGPDWTIKAADGSEQVIKAGDWLVGVVWNEPSWQGILDGRIGGGSMQGKARRRIPAAEALAGLR
jgi:hypothetical protein